ncbi:MAG: HlyD family type I secretion periplasmic adaptor subunit [Gammaproteobacteria bacterium]
MSNVEHEFLPAALEIQQRPPSPLGRLVLWTIVSGFVLAVTWAYVGRVNIVAVARGKLVPAGRVKIIQPLEAGVVRAIRVDEGQRVMAGDLLVELDPTVSEADFGRLQKELQAARRDRTRLRGLARRATGVPSEPDTMGHSPSRTMAEPATAGGRTEFDPQTTVLQQARLESEWQAHSATLRSLDSSVASKRSELDQVRVEVAKLEAIVPLVSRRAEAVKQLAARQLASKQKWLALEQERIERRQALASQRAGLVRLRADIEALNQRRRAAAAEFSVQVLSELSSTERRIQGLQEDLVKARRRASLQRLRAPVSGVIQQLAVHTVGGVVTPAQRLMVIVPVNGALEVDARIANRDIGFVRTGQKAQVKLDAFPFTRYGVLPAELTDISSDAVADSSGRLVFGARARLEQPFVEVGDRQVRLIPGMAVTLEVNTGRRRLIEYLLNPLLRYVTEAARER